MTAANESQLHELKYPIPAYQFLLAALRHTQEKLGRLRQAAEAEGITVTEEQAHVSGQELCEGFREYACEHLGLMALTVLHSWRIRATDDIGEMVFELIDRGEMRKTEQDQLSDFSEVFKFEEAFDRNYHIDVSDAFRKDGK